MKRLSERTADSFYFEYTSSRTGETVEVMMVNGDPYYSYMGEDIHPSEVLDDQSKDILQKVVNALSTVQLNPGFENFMVR